MTSTSSHGVGKREGHDSSAFYGRFQELRESDDKKILDFPWLWRNQIVATSSEDMSQIPDNSVGLMFTSPPYHVGKEYDADIPFDDFLVMLSQVFSETYRVLEPGAKAVINVANLGRSPYIDLRGEVSRMMVDVGFIPRGEIIWQKAEGSSGNCAWGSWCSPSNPSLRDLHEYLLVFSRGRVKRVKRGTATINRDDFMRDTQSIWRVQPESAKRVGHPAPFPVELAKRVINLYSWREDVVLDPFLGSGTTAIAAEQLGRDWVGYELDLGYAALASDRIIKSRVVPITKGKAK